MKNFIKAFLISLSVLAQIHIAMAQTASLLPMGVQQFFDNNGNPLTSGKVYFYEVGTSTLKTTWKNSGETVSNTNPITLDAGGKAVIYGSGTYRQVVKDRNGNLIWDAVTAPGGGSSSPTNIGDGEVVGTIKQWAGLVVPNQYAYAYGQEVSRVTYPELLAAITLTTAVACTTGSNTFTAISDTSQIKVGAAVELICVAPGTTVVSKTSSSVVLSNLSTLTLNTNAVFFNFGGGNGSTTFNVPDLRGVVVAGRNNMGGTASTNLTTAYFLTSPDALGARGGLQSHTQTISEMAVHNHGVTDPGHVHTFDRTVIGTGGGGIFGAGASGNAATIQSAVTGVTVNNAGSGTPFSIVQPTITLNYIIKVTPDTPSSSVTGVSSLGGMQGVIACGQGLNCSANTISANGQLAGGVNTNIQFNNAAVIDGAVNFSYISPDNVTLGAAGITGKFDILGSTSGRVRQVASAVAGTPTITWGNSSGTPAVSASSPLILSATTGALTCPTCVTSSAGGALSATAPIVISGNNVSVTSAALTKVDDTNVTLTLGGSPSTALISAASITVGWSGQLGLTRGGTAASLTASNGGVVYSTASALAILSGTATASLPLLSGSSAAPTWATVSHPTSATSGGVAYFSSTTVMASSGLLGANQIMVGGGAGSPPTTFACATTTTVVHGGTPPTCSQIVGGDITTNTVTNSNLGQAIAATIKGNPTASTANVQDFTIQGLTNLASPSATLDFIPIYDHAAGTIKNVTPGAIAGSVVAGVASVNTLVGALTISPGAGIAAIGASGTTLTISNDVASAANFEAGTANKMLDASVVFSAETTTTYGTTTAFDFNTFINTKVTLTGNITTMNCSNMKASQAGTIAYIQDSTGSRTATFTTGTCSTVLKFAGSAPTLTTSASAIDILSYSCRSSTYCVAALSKGYNP